MTVDGNEKADDYGDDFQDADDEGEVSAGSADDG